MDDLCRKMKTMKNIFINILSALLLFLFFSGKTIWAQSGREKVIEGNKLYNEEKYDEALNKYRDAQVHSPESPVIKFNIGNTNYKKKKYEDAIKEFESSLTNDDVNMQAKAYYNIGNTLYRSGKLPESILSYKKSLELNPEDEDAKYNLEFVRAQLKDQADKQQQNPEQQQQQQQQQQEQQQEQNEENKQDQQEQQQEQQSQNNEEQQEQEEQQQQQQPQPSEEEMSQEDAERILNALEEDQENLKDARKQRMPAGRSIGKDW